MSDNPTPNSFYAMVTGKSDKKEMTLDTPLSIGECAHKHPAVNCDTTPAAALSDSSSQMPHEARRVLVHLMRQGSLMASQKAKLFEQVCRHEMAIRKHLSEVYLQLVLDQKSGVAFVASSASQYADDHNSDNPGSDELDTEEPTTLIPRRTLSLYDTLLLLVLRKHYQDRESAGEQKITIDIERLDSYLTPFLPITDHASKDRKKLLARVKEMVKRKILSTVRGTEERYEITPVIRYVVSANFLESMLIEYTALASGNMNESTDNNDTARNLPEANIRAGGVRESMNDD